MQYLVLVLAPVANAVCVKVYAFIFWEIAIAFTSFENHKSIFEYEDFLVAKVFIFSLLNNLNSFFLIAFVKTNTDIFGKCVTSNEDLDEDLKCYFELRTQVQFFFLIQFFVSFLEIILPPVFSMLGYCFRSEKLSYKKDYDLKEIDIKIEEQFDLSPFQTTVEVDGVLKEYMEIMIQFAFLSFFGVAFPFAFTIGYFHMAGQIAIDKHKLLRQYRRPIPKGAKDIGTWRTIIDLISFFSIFFNAALVVITSKSADPLIEVSGQKGNLKTGESQE